MKNDCEEYPVMFFKSIIGKYVIIQQVLNKLIKDT